MLVGLQLAATADLLLTPHSLCPEHGQVVRVGHHLDHAHHPLPPGISASSARPERPGIEHVHALFKTPVQDPLVPSSGLATRVVVLEQAPARPGGTQVLAPLTVAPKGSPPS